MSQMFRFCLRCVRMSLIEDGCYSFCNTDMIIKGENDKLKKREKENAEPY